MKNHKLEKLGMTVGAACLSMVMNASQAAPLITFSNGTVADADDVNANFSELETRINTISLTPGPAGADGAAGPQGPMGPKGPAGANGAGVVTYAWGSYSPSGWDMKTFIVTNAPFDKEVQSFVRTSTGAGSGTTQITRQRTLLGEFASARQVLHFEWQVGGDFTFTGIDSYDPVGETLIDTITHTPGIKQLHGAMEVGKTWANGVRQYRTFTNGASPIETIYVDSHALVGIEDISVQGVDYTGCLKILNMINSPVLSWYCPSGVGLVKRMAGNNGLIMEFDPTQSTPSTP